MSRRRGENSTPISLFSFQDIITSITGIMILVTLLMTLELLQRKVAAPVHQTAKIIKQLQPVVEQQDREIEQLEEALKRDEETLRELAAVDRAEVRRQMEDLERLRRQLENDLETLHRQESAADSRVQKSEVEKTRHASDAATLENLTKRIREAQQKLKELKSSNRVIYNVSSDAHKTSWLVEVDADRILIARAGESAKPTLFSGDRSTRAAEFLRWAAARDKTAEYFMLLLKPEGVETFSQLLDGLKRGGFQVGFDLIASGQVAVDPTTGAIAP